MRTVIGQRCYKTIEAPTKTLACAALIVTACFLNTILCRSIASEIAGGFALIAILVLMYRTQIKEAVISLRRSS